MTPRPQAVLKFESRSPPRSMLQLEQQPSLGLLAFGMIGLGVLALSVGDFAMVWQPVAAWFPARTILAYAAGALMLLCGAGLFFRATSVWATRILFPYLIVWQLLKLPALFVAPKVEGVYLGFGELALLLAGGWTLFARLGDVRAPACLAWATGDTGVRLARYYFALWLIPIGLSHWIYTKETVELIPPWLPFKTGWAYLTGAGQMASGLGMLFGVFPRLAAWAEAGQIMLYTLLIWLPAIFATPRGRLAWTALWISWTIGAAAWVVAQNTPSEPAIEQKNERR
jgi:uncharacterized membrane protein